MKVDVSWSTRGRTMVLVYAFSPTCGKLLSASMCYNGHAGTHTDPLVTRRGRATYIYADLPLAPGSTAWFHTGMSSKQNFRHFHQGRHMPQQQAHAAGASLGVGGPHRPGAWRGWARAAALRLRPWSDLAAPAGLSDLQGSHVVMNDPM